MTPRSLALLPALLALCLMALLSGCSGGGGATGVIEGVVTDATTDSEVADAYIYIPEVRGVRQANLVETFTDDSGAFRIEGVPLDRELELHVEAPEGSDAVGAVLPLIVPGDLRTLVQFASLVPGPTAGVITDLSIDPPSAELRRADLLSFTATISGPSAPVRPTWWVEGDIGRITPGGVFLALRPGSGYVAAAAGPVTNKVPVTVLTDVAPWAVLVITSLPPSAAIYVDDLDIGKKTPWIARVAPGQHTVEVRLPDLPPAMREFEVRQGDVLPLHFRLLPSGPTGAVRVLTDPPGAAVMLDGHTTGALAPVILAPVSAGDHRVTALLRGYEKQSQAVSVPAGAATEVTLTLVPIATGG